MTAIKELRKAANMSQNKFATYLGIPVANIQHWEQGVSKPPRYIPMLIYRVLTIGYTLFVTFISIFPILGMLGTVTALLGLDLSGESAAASARTGFFNALTSTAWGIIFAVIFKIVNAVISQSVENNIQQVTDLINQNRENIRKKKGKLSDLIKR